MTQLETENATVAGGAFETAHFPVVESTAIVHQNGAQVNQQPDITPIVNGALTLDVPPPVEDFQPPPRAFTDADMPGDLHGPALPVATITGGFLSAVDLLQKQFAPVAWAVDGMLPEGAFLLGGRPKMGKSWLALSIALAVATGGRALGRAAVAQGDVLVLALEDNERRLQERLRTLLAGDEAADVSRLTVRTDCPRLDKGGTLVVQSWLESHPGARLVVVDTLAKIKQRRRAGGDAYAEDYDAVQPFVELAKRHRVTLLIITHLRKLGMNEDVFDAITGTLGTTGGVDGALVLARERGRAEAVLHVTGRDLPRDLELALTWDATTAQWTIAGDADEYRLSKLQAAIVATVRDNGQPMAPKEVAQALAADGMSVEYANVRKTMARLAQSGDLYLCDYGKYELPPSKL
jgi:hypothetical protein